MKTCTKCKQEKPYSEFATNKTKKDGHNYDCKQCHKIYRDKHYKDNKIYYIKKAADYTAKTKKYINELKEKSCCSKCGIKHPAVLDFHHKDPNKKKIEVSKASGIHNIKQEIKKCEILCSNCHRILHWEENKGY